MSLDTRLRSRLRSPPYGRTDRRLLRAWKSSGVPVEPVEEAAARRDVLVDRLGDFIELAGKRQRRAQRRWALGSVAAAVVVLVGVAAIGWKHAQPERAGQSARMGGARNTLAGIVVSGARVEVARVTGATTVTDGSAALGVGDRVTRALAGASISMPSGAHAELRAAPRASVIATDEHTLKVGVGTLEVRVVPQAAPNRFTVVTPDARVSVRGTVFAVAVTDDVKPRIKTRVSVTEGVVSVEHDGRTWLVGAGQSWPETAPLERSAERPAAGAPAPAPSLSVPPERIARKSGTARETLDMPPADESIGAAALVGGRRLAADAPALVGGRRLAADAPALVGGRRLAADAPAPSSATTSALPEQNRLFAAAMAAKGEGRDGDTVRLLGELLGRYPGSPLAQEARVERFRALSRLGRSDEAAREARRYLAEYPGGFARDEARGVALPQTR